MVHTEPNGEQTFRIYLPTARAVELVGSFTSWRRDPVPMSSDRGGWWTASVGIGPGDHEFSYLVDGCTWIADYAASGVKPNGFGGFVSQLYVEDARRGPAVLPMAA